MSRYLNTFIRATTKEEWQEAVDWYLSKGVMWAPVVTDPRWGRGCRYVCVTPDGYLSWGCLHNPETCRGEEITIKKYKDE